jgi:hypothetical protein
MYNSPVELSNPFNENGTVRFERGAPFTDVSRVLGEHHSTYRYYDINQNKTFTVYRFEGIKIFVDGITDELTIKIVADSNGNMVKIYGMEF